ncbi:MAG: class I SAM-dependent rRNA methyltransferase [Pseudomonadota bacterium]
MKYNAVTLKKGRDFPIKNRHHWIFSGAIQDVPEYTNGEILAVKSSGGEMLGHAYFNKNTSISGRMLNFDNTPPIESIKKNIKSAITLRKNIFNGKYTNCYRVINGEGDCIPGLVVDKYNDVLVVQINTTGMSLLKDVVIASLIENYGSAISCIYEKSVSGARIQDGIPAFEGFLYGDKKNEVDVVENGIPFNVNFVTGQKTGLFLDMREMRKLIMEISSDKSILNCFCYSAGFSMYAAKGGAKSSVSIDTSKEAIAQAGKNFELNKMDVSRHKLVTGDVFDYLRDNKLDHNIIILDPPAFARKKSDINNAKRGYMEINRTALSKMPSESFLLTCSCSYYIDEKMFESIIFNAARETGRSVKIISKHRLAPDHTVNIYHPEFDYIKSLLLYVS